MNWLFLRQCTLEEDIKVQNAEPPNTSTDTGGVPGFNNLAKRLVFGKKCLAAAAATS